MYILITLVHLLFIIGSHLLSYYLLEGIFIFLFLFFLLYFSPIFFTKEKMNLPNISLESFSPKNSITLPLLFVYGALYIFLFGLLPDVETSFQVSLYTLIFGFILFFGYMLITDWKNDIFFDVTRMHLIMSLSVSLLFIVLSFVLHFQITVQIIALLGVSIIFSLFFFKVSREESPILFQSFILAIIALIYSAWNFVTHDASLGTLLSIMAIVSIILFEFMPKSSFFTQFLIESKITTLSLILGSSLGIMGLSIWDFSYFPIIFIILVFLLSVHARYSNYIAFFIGILSLFFLYGNTFFSLISASSLFSSLLFVFFLPLCIIGSTYFWEERFPYDFSMLHYTSITFSSLFSLYIIFFIGWGPATFFVVSGTVFLTGILLLLSYFRFRYR